MSRGTVLFNAVFGSVAILAIMFACGLLIYDGFIPVLKEFNKDNTLLAQTSGVIFFTMIGLMFGGVWGCFASDIRSMWHEALEKENRS